MESPEKPKPLNQLLFSQLSVDQDNEGLPVSANIKVSHRAQQNVFGRGDITITPEDFVHVDVDYLANEVRSILEKYELSFVRVGFANFVASNPGELARAGFLSGSQATFTGLAILNLSLDENKFWFFDYINEAKNYRVWLYASIDFWRQSAIRTAQSLPLLLYAPELCYRGSLRPRTDMSMFRTPDSIVAYRDQFHPINQYEYEVTLQGQDYRAMPVTRYAAGMSGGLYYDPTTTKTTKFCGTFYYHEPESTTFLTYQVGQTFKDKRSGAEHYNLPFKFAEKWKRLDLLPSDLVLSPAQVAKYLTDYWAEPDPVKLDLAKKIKSTPRYAGIVLGFYAAEDELDQPLCEAAEKAGIEVTLLTHMVGSHKIVAEIMDSRPRNQSFESLVYTI